MGVSAVPERSRLGGRPLKDTERERGSAEISSSCTTKENAKIEHFEFIKGLHFMKDDVNGIGTLSYRWVPIVPTYGAAL